VTFLPPFLEVKNLKKHFLVKARGLFNRTPIYLRAVDEVSFSIQRGETLGLVGESGCGKTTIARLVMNLLPSTSGEVLLEGENIFQLTPLETRQLRRDIQMIFQDPYASLNPRRTVRAIISNPLEIHGIARGKEREYRVNELLQMVGLAPEYALRYPHEFSGGQRQRIGIARALATNPKLIVCDEPTSALDVSVRARILNLLNHLQEQQNSAYLFISHDLAVVSYLADEIAVIYLGQLMEVGRASGFLQPPYHPYTEALLSAFPLLDPGAERERIRLEGEIPSPTNVPSGCPFHTRCPRFLGEICVQEKPPWQVDEDGHGIYCHIPLGELRRLQRPAFRLSRAQES